MNSGVVLDFRHIAEIVKAQYINDSFICPTNQTYAVTKENFRYVFPNYLQSYEISLLGLSSLEVAKRYPEVQFIGQTMPKRRSQEILACTHVGRIANRHLVTNLCLGPRASD